MWNFIICIEIHWILNNWKMLRSEVLRWPIAFFFEIGKAWLLNILETHKILLFFYRIVIESRLNAKNKYERVWIFFLSWINFRTKIGNLSFFFERLFFCLPCLLEFRPDVYLLDSTMLLIKCWESALKMWGAF